MIIKKIRDIYYCVLYRKEKVHMVGNRIILTDVAGNNWIYYDDGWE